MSADLHVHSCYSDGCLAPKDLVEEALRLGLAGLALTDHDTLAGIPEIYTWGERLGLSLLTGVELSVGSLPDEYHILGFFPGMPPAAFRNRLQDLAAARLTRAQAMVERLQEHGVVIGMESVQKLAGEGVIGRPHLAAALVKSGYAESISDAFLRYLEPGGPGFISREKLQVAEAIALINEAGGVAFWAHPGVDFSLERLQKLIEYGLAGIEVWHPAHSPELARQILALAQESGLLVSGGSDFHCPGEGRTLGSHRTPPWALQALRSKLGFGH